MEERVVVQILGFSLGRGGLWGGSGWMLLLLLPVLYGVEALRGPGEAYAAGLSELGVDLGRCFCDGLLRAWWSCFLLF